MNDTLFQCATKILIGDKAEQDVAKLVRQHGGTKVLVHYGSERIRKTGLLDRVLAILDADGIGHVELGGVVPNPRLSLVYEGIDLVRKHGLDFILAIGGGSVIDSAKAIGMGVPYDGDVWNFYLEKDGAALDVPKACLPIGVILTIAATGSEASFSSVITKEDENLKRFCDNDVNRPVFAIENPTLTYTLPPFQTACGIADIMSHSMERYFTCEKGGNYLTDHLCEAIFHTCMDCAQLLLENPEDYEARAAVMLASSFSHNGLTGIGRSGDWGSHMIEHELSGEFDVAHGAGLAVITPAWMKYVYRENMDLFLKFATRVMGVQMNYDHPEITVEEGIARLESFFRRIGLPVRLSEMPQVGNPSDEVFRKMAARVRFARPNHTIGGVKQLDKDDIFNILTLAR